MTTINIYENKTNEESLILQEEVQKEFDEIKKALTDLQKQNKDLKKLLIDLNLKLLKKEVENDKKVESKELKVSDKVKTGLKEIKEIETKQVNQVKNQRLTKTEIKECQSKILEKIPIFTKRDAKNYRKYLQREYELADSKQKKELLKHTYTVLDMMEDLQVKRYDIEEYVLKPLLEKGTVKFFKLHPTKKSKKIFYRIGSVTTGLKVGEQKEIKRTFYQDSDKYVTPDLYKMIYSGVKLLSDGTIEYHTKGNSRKFTLNYDIYDVLYVKSISDSSNFTMGDFRRLYHLRDEWDRITLHKLIYNIRENPSFDEIVAHARKVFTTDMSFDKKGDLLKINDTITFIPVHQARSWCDAYMNNNKDRDVFIWELQKRFIEINKDYIAIILYNNANDELVDVLKENKNNFDFVENNPSKRRNLIMNGGMI